MARSEYTRLRDIAQKRLGRLQEAGLAPSGLSFPKLRELKTEKAKERALAEVQSFIASGTKLRDIRGTGNVIDITPKGIGPVDRARAERNARQRAQRARRKEVLEGLTKEQRSMIKGAKKLGLSIKTADIPAFLEYMEYRFSQYTDSRFYLFSDYAEDFWKAKKSHKTADIVNDFARFMRERRPYTSMLAEHGYSGRVFQKIWNRFLGE